MYVWTQQDSAGVEADSPRSYRRRVEIEITLIVRGAARHGGLEFDSIDEIGQLIEDAMANVEFDGARNVTLRSFQGGTSAESEKPLGVGRWVYELEYSETAPRVLVGEETPLNSIHVKYDLAGSPEGAEAEDHLQTNTQD